MAAINVRDLTFSYEGSYTNVFEGVSFAFDTNWRLGLIGRNGRGKTTLLRLLQGGLAHEGLIDAPLRFTVFPHTPRDIKKAAFEVADEIAPGHEFWELCRETNLLGLPEETLFRPYGTLSGGEQTKLGIAALFLSERDFPLIDEPTNHLDKAGREAVSEYLSRKKGFLLVSHDRALLDAVCDHMMYIGRLGVEVASGNFSQWNENKEARDRREEAENVKLEKEIKRQRQAAMRTAEWADKVESTKTGAGPVDRGYIGHKSAKMMKRAKSAESRRQKAVLAKGSLLKDIDRAGELKLRPLDHHSARIATLEDVSVSYGKQPVLENFSMEVARGERIAISGPNGSGKSSVLKLIAGIDVPHTGLVRLASGLIVSYVPQDTSLLTGDLSSFAVQARTDLTLFMAILRNLGFERSDFDADMEELSEGQRKKALLARSIATSAHLYVWDEPLNFVDVISRAQIEELILKDCPSMVFVEHDRVFTEKISTRNVEIVV